MPTPLQIPRLEMAMTEGGLAEWLVADGAQVNEGDPIYVLETSKASQDVVAPASGVLRHKAAAGEIYPVGTDIGEIE
jgi:pyruvate/2-oxoglutarate dehydrogenase complex dihydrolipoamide acyltransferase (E2) component